MNELVALAILAVPFVAVGAWWAVVSQHDGMRDHLGTYVAVQLENTVIRGVLTGVHRDVLVLRDAAELTEAADVSIEEALIPRARITYVQTGVSITEDALK